VFVESYCKDPVWYYYNGNLHDRYSSIGIPGKTYLLQEELAREEDIGEKNAKINSDVKASKAEDNAVKAKANIKKCEFCDKPGKCQPPENKSRDYKEEEIYNKKLATFNKIHQIKSKKRGRISDPTSDSKKRKKRG